MSIIATILSVAAFVGALVYGESLGDAALLGIFIIVLSQLIDDWAFDMLIIGLGKK